VAAVTPVVVDTEPVGIEADDVDAATARVRTGTADKVVLKQTLSAQKEMNDHSHEDNSGRRYFLVYWQQTLLIFEGLIQGTINGVETNLAVTRLNCAFTGVWSDMRSAIKTSATQRTSCQGPETRYQTFPGLLGDPAKWSRRQMKRTAFLSG
jgi:hypothetical protein